MHFYIFTGGERNPLYDILFSDLKSLYNVTLISSLPAIPKNKEKLWKLHHSKSMNQIFELPFRAAWNRYSMMEDIISNVDENCCFVFSNVAMEYYEPSLLRIYQKKYGVKMVLYLLDTFDSYYSSGARLACNRVSFDAIYTYHRPDAIRYGFRFFDTYYSRLSVTKQEVSSDVFFWGSEKGRGQQIRKIYTFLKDNGFCPRFGVCYANVSEYKKLDIECNQELTYQSIVNAINSTQCIVDLTGESSKGISLRVFEAVVYGKKILTDNSEVQSMRGIDPKNVKYFSDWETFSKDFTKEWLNKKSGQKAIYQDEYSPIHFVKQMEKDLRL